MFLLFILFQGLIVVAVIVHADNENEAWPLIAVGTVGTLAIVLVWAYMSRA